MNNNKITFIIGKLTGGGAERVVSVLSNRFANKGYKVDIICLFDTQVTYKIDSKINIHFIIGRAKTRFFRHIEKLIKLRKLLGNINPHVIISFLYDVNIATIISKIFMKNKLVISERNDPNNDPDSKLMRFIRDYFYNFSDGFVFQTPDAKLYFNKYIQNKGVVIGNPINTDIPEPYFGERRKEIVCVNRLEKQKNISMLINAFKEFSKNHDDYKLIIYGQGPLKEELENQIQSLKLIDKVYLAGYSTNIYEDVRYSSLFVLPSNFEGISNALLEALALGLPVIATDCPIGGSRMYITSYENGILIPVGHTKALANAMKDVIDNKELANAMSSKAMTIRDILSVNKICGQWESYIRDTLGDKP